MKKKTTAKTKRTYVRPELKAVILHSSLLMTSPRVGLNEEIIITPPKKDDEDTDLRG